MGCAAVCQLGEAKSTERQDALCTPAMDMPCCCSNARTIAVHTSSRASGAVSLVKLQAPAADELGFARSLAVQASWALAGLQEGAAEQGISTACSWDGRMPLALLGTSCSCAALTTNTM